MNIAIVRAFIALRQFSLNYKDIVYQVNEIRRTISSHSEQLNQIYDAIENMMDEKAGKAEAEEKWLTGNGSGSGRNEHHMYIPVSGNITSLLKILLSIQDEYLIEFRRRK